MADAFCSRCGFHRRDATGSRAIEFCFYCSDGVADDVRATRLVEAAAEGDRDACRVLADVTDGRTLAVLTGASDHPDEIVRRAVWAALAGIADPATTEAAILAAEDPDVQVSEAAITLLTRIGDKEALARLLHAPGAGWLAAQALGWLGDSRALEPLLMMLRSPESLARANTYWNPVAALVQLGDPSAIPSLVEVLDRIVSPTPGNFGASLVSTALQDLGGPQADAPIAEARERLGQLYRFSPLDRRRTALSKPFAVRAPGAPARTVPKWSLELRDASGPITTPETKFGGQPVWIAPPSWPLTKSQTPMTFFAQFAIPWSPGSIAYLFVDVAGEDTFDPYSGDSALIVQPGPPPKTPSHPSATGPSYPATSEEPVTVYRGRAHNRLAEFVPTLEPGTDPIDWSDLGEAYFEGEDDPRDWNKIGGTPVFLQGEEWPAGDGWHFLFQFSAWLIGHDFGDAAECYGFVNDDQTGVFLWQCH